MKVVYIDNEEMKKVFGVSLETILSPVYGCFEFVEGGGRTIYLLDDLSIIGKITVLFHELYHWMTSYFQACTDRLDEIWDVNLDWFWNIASKYFK